MTGVMGFWEEKTAPPVDSVGRDLRERSEEFRRLDPHAQEAVRERWAAEAESWRGVKASHTRSIERDALDGLVACSGGVLMLMLLLPSEGWASGLVSLLLACLLGGLLGVIWRMVEARQFVCMSTTALVSYLVASPGISFFLAPALLCLLSWGWWIGVSRDSGRL